MTGRPREFDRDAALQAAMLLFWRKGFAAASMNDLCEAMEIRSPSLYAAFGSKEALYLEAIQHYVEVVGPHVWGPLAKSGTARTGVRELLRAGAQTLPESTVMPAGCMAMLAAVGDEWPSPLVETARSIRGSMLESLRLRISRAIDAGELPASTDVESLSRFYLSVMQGMAIQARDGATAAQLEIVADAAMAAWPKRAAKKPD